MYPRCHPVIYDNFANGGISAFRFHATDNRSGLGATIGKILKACLWDSPVTTRGFVALYLAFLEHPKDVAVRKLEYIGSFLDGVERHIFRHQGQYRAGKSGCQL
jgi:hypothetical protein